MVNSTFSFLDNKTDKPYSNDENFVIFSPDHHELYIAAYKMFFSKTITRSMDTICMRKIAKISKGLLVVVQHTPIILYYKLFLKTGLLDYFFLFLYIFFNKKNFLPI